MACGSIGMACLTP
ncbi:hypothetical protein L2D45_29255 [Vibrio harveyi]